jgi:O-antigen/teichoic acid export membrane protein
VGIVVNVLCTVLFLVTYDMGVEGIFLAGVVSSATTLAILVPVIVANFRPRIARPLLSAMVTYGWPTVPAGLAAMAIQVIDRPVLEALTDTATVGIYQANYRLGIFMMLVVSMVDFAWRPFMFSHAADSDARQMFARVLSYFVLLMAVVFVLLYLFLDAVVQAPVFLGYSILPEAYWSGLSIVPVVLMGYVFLGMSNIFSAGLYLERQRSKLPLVTFAGAAVNIISNLLLIPLWGIMGAAVATLLSYTLMAVMMYILGTRAYEIPFEWGRLGRIFLAVGGVVLFDRLLPAGIAWRIVLMLLFPVLLYWLRVFSPSEVARLRRLFRRSGSDAAAPGSEEPGGLS